MIRLYWGKSKTWRWAMMTFCTGQTQWQFEGDTMRRESGINGDIKGMYGISFGTKIFLGIILISRHGPYFGQAYKVRKN